MCAKQSNIKTTAIRNPKYNLAVKLATLQDAPALANLSAQLNHLHTKGRPDEFRILSRHKQLQFWKSRLNRKGQKTWLARVRGRAIGFIAADLISRTDNTLLRDKRIIYVSQIFVDKSYRRCSIGSALFDTVSKFAHGNEIYTIELDIWAFNSISMRFFSSLGFFPSFTRLTRTSLKNRLRQNRVSL